ncbi:efflux transporter, RND family, MFP subunit [Caldalkalibacillus thermarum TA2.A1]|uniref:Efflux RND transporter periplasmic adaptor subunit n=1 Tax=Caldalkalibacillus thermarum (strain TA2.A1) TaxID=986075 RepID=F5L6Q8_CALTT|nr:biotin/lipoyl-binding protein [Caldalkalibacillus thermarum]EGL82951.1 efflux transporter, RND family, MFP subunit [Caldalkalibacillus thermarum TA2.A1]QZT33607.1 efflux RND transporter periplasmic adaptor subunit [Caldalkalibacillus thermarum TA2.A1]
MKKALIIVGVVAVIATLIGLNLYMNTAQPATSVQAELLETMVVEGETLHDSLIASGQVVPAHFEEVYFDPALGELDEILVEEGQEIEAGTPLFRYKNEQLDVQLQQLDLQNKRLALQVEDITQQKKNNEREISETRRKLQQACDEQNEYEAERLQELLNQLEREKEQLALQERLLQLDQEEQKVQREQLRSEENKLVVTSRTGGIVQKIDEQAVLQQGLEPTPLIIIESTGQYLVQGTISEYDTVHVQTGQEVIIKPKVLASETWEGQVVDVEFIPQALMEGMGMGGEAQITYYPFTVEITEDKPGLKHGYHVTVEIMTDVREDAILLPFEAFMEMDEEEYVYVLNEGRLEQRLVTTGSVNEKGKEVTSGVTIGETVVLNPAADWTDGMEVVSNDPAD